MMKFQPENPQAEQPGRELRNQSGSYRSFAAILLLAGGNIVFASPQVHAAQQSAKTLYATNCAVCHGLDAEGAMPGVKDLAANSSWMDKTDAELTTIIVNGVQGSDSPVPMPPRAGNPDLTNEQIMSIVTYLRKLAAGNQLP